MDTTGGVKLVELMFESLHRQETVETECREENLKAVLKEESVETYFKENKVLEVGTEEVQKPTIIDLNTCRGVQGSSDVSMALVVVTAPPDVIQENGHISELAVVRVHNMHIGDRTSESGALGERARNQFNPLTAEFIAELPSPGNGHGVAKLGLLEGPPRWASSQIGILTVQCARCLKWRVVPAKEQYEAIREHILETPWVCENALQWKPDAHCGLPTDLNPDSQSLWAIDKPNLPSSPLGWQRKVVVRKDCSTKFADVYYTAPDGKLLRSMVEVSKYLEDNPASVPKGTKLNQFSYTIPQPLPGVWAAPAKKRNAIRSVVNLSSSQSRGKKARGHQPLAKQLAQKLLHGTNPPSLPVAPPFLSHVAPSFLVPVAPSFTFPYATPSVPLLASQASSYPPAPNFTNPPALPLLPLPLPLMQNPQPHLSPFVHTHSKVLREVSSHASQGSLLTSSTVGQPDPNSTSISRRKKLQQKSRLGVATSLSQNLKLPGILPLREPNGV